MKRLIILIFIFLNFKLYGDDYQELRDLSESYQLTYNHDILKTFEGKFRLIYFYSPEEAKPEKGTGKGENIIILNQRYLELNRTLNFKNEKVNKKTIIGYDGISKEYSLTEYSDIETFPLQAKGKFYPEKKEIIFEGKYPHSKINSNNFRIVIKYQSIDSFLYTFYEMISGIETKILEINYIKLE